MSPHELNKMIQRIKKLPDKLLIRLMLAAARELDKRGKRYAREAARRWE